MHNNIAFLILIFLISSCSSKKEKIVNLITNDKVKYWDIVDTTDKVKWGYSFSKNGTCLYYYYDGENICSRHIMDDDDLIYEDTWLLKNDSILNFRSTDKKILRLTEDTLLTEYKGKKLLLVKSKCN